MASRNQLALDQGRITQAQFESMAAYKAIYHYNYEDLDPNKDYTDYGLIKAGYQVQVRYPYIINDPQAFVKKCFGDHFGTYDDQPDDCIIIHCNSWLWAPWDATVADIDWGDDIPNIYDHAKIIDESYYLAY